jgi:DNA-binding CsgD family transcriptional regulator
MLNDRFTSVLGASSVLDLHEHVLKFSKWLGFDLMSAFVAVDKPAGDTAFYCIDNAPEDYRSTFEDDDFSHRDPVMRHCKRFSTPIIWDQRTYVDSGTIDKWERQAPFGYRAGVAIALHLPDGRHFVIGVDRGQAMPRHPAERQRMAIDLCAFAAFAQEAAMRLFLPPPARQFFGRLSARELEALRWTMAGKTAWEVGVILGISEQTVVRHLGHAAQKLGCVNKVQAVAKALQMGLIG